MTIGNSTPNILCKWVNPWAQGHEVGEFLWWLLICHQITVHPSWLTNASFDMNQWELICVCIRFNSISTPSVVHQVGVFVDCLTSWKLKKEEKGEKMEKGLRMIEFSTFHELFLKWFTDEMFLISLRITMNFCNFLYASCCVMVLSSHSDRDGWAEVLY